jgi:hypothetical protein
MKVNILNNAILKKIESTSDRLIKENIQILLPLIHNHSLFSNITIIDRIIKIFQNNLANTLSLDKIVTLLRIFTFIHSKVVERREPIDAIFKLILSKIDINGLSKLPFNLKINMTQCIVYLKSIDYEVDEYMNAVVDDKVIKFMKRGIITLFHRDILFNLTMMNFNYSVEDFTNMLSKDVVILLGNRKICIEANGVSHFYRDRKLKKFFDEFKNQTLINYGWEVYDIDYFDWIKIPKENRKDYLNKLINK